MAGKKGKKPGLEASKWAPSNKQQRQVMAAPRPYMNPNLATTLNLGLGPATPRPESVPSLMATAVPEGSSSPAGEEAVTPQQTQERRESFMSSVHKADLADEVFQDDTDITVVNPPTPSPVKAKDNQLPASALPFTLRSSSLPQPSVADKMAGAKPSSSAAVPQVKVSSHAPLDISERFASIKRKHLGLDKHDDQAGVKNDEKAVQDEAEAMGIEAVQFDTEKAVVARIEAERIANEHHEAAAKESKFREMDKAHTAAKEAQRLEKEKAQAAAKEAERSGKEKAQAASKEKEKAYAAAKEAERRAKEAERLAKEKAQAIAKEKEKAYAAAKEAERRAKEAERRAKEAERRAKEKAQAAAKEAERVAKEKEQAARLAQEKAAVKLELEKVIMTTQVQCRTIGTHIDKLKDDHAKSNKKDLEELQPVQLYVEELKQEQEEISQLMTLAVTDVENAQEVLGQAQAIVDNLKDKADSLLYTLVDVNMLISDKEKNMSGRQKDAEAQVTALVLKQNERFKNLEQAVRKLAVLETSSRAEDLQKVVGEVEAKATTEISDQAHGEVEAPVKSTGQVSGKAKLDEPFDESFSADRTAEEGQNIETDGKGAANRGELAVRRVKLTNLPSNATLKHIVPLVWGGNVQEFVYADGQSWAEVVFVTSEGCKRFFDSTPNGMVFPGSKDRHVEVEACPPEIAREIVKEIIEKGMTRCVRVLDVEPDHSKLALENFAAGKDNKRAVDMIVRGLSQGRPVVDFRFGSIADAVIFKAELHRSLEWESYTSSFGEDPCATHSGAHK